MKWFLSKVHIRVASPPIRYPCFMGINIPTKEELIDYAQRTGAPMEVVENLQEIEDEGEVYECIEDIWPDYPSKDDFFFQEDEY